MIGVIAVQSYTNGDTYSHIDLEILAAVSHQTAMAIDRKRSLEDLKKKLKRDEYLPCRRQTAGYGTGT